MPNILCLCNETFSVCLYIKGIYQIFGDNPTPPPKNYPTLIKTKNPNPCCPTASIVFLPTPRQ